MLLVSYKVVFIENDAVLLCVTILERARAFAVTIWCVTFDIAFAIKKFSFCSTLFKCIWHGDKKLVLDHGS